MYGVPANLPLRKLQGMSLLACRPVSNIIYFDLGSAETKRVKVQIGVEARWELRSHGGAFVVGGSPIPPDDPETRTAIGATVVSFAIRAPASFVLIFDSGHELEVFDSNDRYESFSIPQWNVYV